MTLSAYRTLPLMPPTAWMGFSDGYSLGSHDAALIDSEDAFNFDLDPSDHATLSLYPETVFTTNNISLGHPLTAPASSSPSPVIRHYSGTDHNPNMVHNNNNNSNNHILPNHSSFSQQPNGLPIHSSIPDLGYQILPPNFSPPRSPVMIGDTIEIHHSPSGVIHQHQPSHQFAYNQSAPPPPHPPASISPIAWFDSLTPFDSHLSCPSTVATYSTIPSYDVSVSCSGQSSVIADSDLRHNLNPYASLSAIPASYSISVAPHISPRPASLDFGSTTPVSSVTSSNPLAAAASPYLMPPPPSSGVTFDRLVPVISQSPDMSPTIDPHSHSAPFDGRPNKRQKNSKSVPISPNLLSESLQITRTTPKTTRQDSADGDSEDRKGQCPIPECGRVFKDLKAHMLTHQTERPEKCPIPTCEYHFKGFARKYDKNRHTLTHYRGTMVCIFCPGSGSTTEQTFNRVDAFKKHLTMAHGVEQAPPNSRKRNSSGRPINQPDTLSTAVIVNTNLSGTLTMDGHPSRSDALCSTCSLEFRSPQEFYEHLDDCVLRIVQQLDPTEMYNERNLGAIMDDQSVISTLARHNLPAEGDVPSLGDDDQDDNSSDLGKDSETPTRSRHNSGSAVGKRAAAASNAIPQGSNRRRRRNYPTSWGCPTEKMNIRKRVMCVYGGSTRLCKDNMVLDREYEVRVKLADGKSYVTDLDVQMLNRAEDLLDGRDGQSTVSADGAMLGPHSGMVPIENGDSSAFSLGDDSLFLA